ncbi:PAS domain-containing protein [Bradyrhizobium sp.]|uniref:PAS domain-containing protein n=1 Tax=Bradyrhizobium sp. TaxID=376 RepID=UPI0039E68CB8
METAAGIYTSIIFPDALSKSNPQLSEIQMAMLDATPDCIKVLSTDGKLLTMNRAGRNALGVPANSKYGMEWLDLLPEEVRPAGRRALGKAAAGNAARFPGQSISSSGTLYWDNLLVPVADAEGRILSVLCVSRDVTAKAVLEKELEEAINRERLLSGEMQHRIKNLFSVVAGLISMCEREAAHDQAPETATKLLRDKVLALSRASDAAFSLPDGAELGSDTFDLASLISSVLKPYGDKCSVSGSAIQVQRNIMTNLALYLHELATNSMKYGALSAIGGNVVVDFSVSGTTLDLLWIERGGPVISNSPARQGFGGEMVDRIMSSIGGLVQRSWQPEGLVARLQLPDVITPPSGAS